MRSALKSSSDDEVTTSVWESVVVARALDQGRQESHPASERRIRSASSEQRIRSAMMESLEEAIVGKSDAGAALSALLDRPAPVANNVFLSAAKLTDPPPPWESPRDSTYSRAASPSTIPTIPMRAVRGLRVDDVVIREVDVDAEFARRNPAGAFEEIDDAQSLRPTLPAPPKQAAPSQSAPTSTPPRRRRLKLLVAALTSRLRMGVCADRTARRHVTSSAGVALHALANGVTSLGR